MKGTIYTIEQLRKMPNEQFLGIMRGEIQTNVIPKDGHLALICT